MRTEFNNLVVKMKHYDLYQKDDEVGEALNNLEAKIKELELRIIGIDKTRREIYQTISKYTRSVDGDVERIDLTREDHDNIQACTHDVCILLDLEDSMPIDENWYGLFGLLRRKEDNVELSNSGIPYRYCINCNIKEEETVMTKIEDKHFCCDCEPKKEIDTYSVEKKDEIEKLLISKWAILGMDIPNNFEDIVQFVYEDVCETADPVDWHDGDVVIGFRRWVEAQGDKH